jgi:hypothetical protein
MSHDKYCSASIMLGKTARPHKPFHGLRQRYAASLLGLFGMDQLIVLHLLHDRTRGMVLYRQARQVTVQVCRHLSFSFYDKAQADFVAQAAGQQAQAKCTGIPKWVE